MDFFSSKKTNFSILIFVNIGFILIWRLLKNDISLNSQLFMLIGLACFNRIFTIVYMFREGNGNKSDLPFNLIIALLFPIIACWFMNELVPKTSLNNEFGSINENSVNDDDKLDELINRLNNKQ